jgi:hypothetical protein
MRDQPQESHHEAFRPSSPGYLAVLLAQLPQCPIEHRSALHTEGPFRDRSSTERSRSDRRLREDEETSGSPFRQRRSDVTVPNGKVTRRNHLSDEPVIQQLGCCKLKSDSVLIPRARIGEGLPTVPGLNT